MRRWLLNIIAVLVSVIWVSCDWRMKHYRNNSGNDSWSDEKRLVSALTNTDWLWPSATNQTHNSTGGDLWNWPLNGTMRHPQHISPPFNAFPTETEYWVGNNVRQEFIYLHLIGWRIIVYISILMVNAVFTGSVALVTSPGKIKGNIKEDFFLLE